MLVKSLFSELFHEKEVIRDLQLLYETFHIIYNLKLLMLAMKFCEPQTKVGTSVTCHRYIFISFKLSLLSSDMTMSNDKTVRLS